MPVEVIDFDFDTAPAGGKQPGTRGDFSIPATVERALPAIGATATVALMLLASEADPDRLVTMSARSLASRLGLSWPTAIMLFKRLRKNGFLERVGGGFGNETSTYRVTVNPQPI